MTTVPLWRKIFIMEKAMCVIWHRVYWKSPNLPINVDANLKIFKDLQIFEK